MNTGDPRNVMIVRKGSTAESSSRVSREQLKVIQYWPEIERNVRINRSSPPTSPSSSTCRAGMSVGKRTTMRGVTPLGMELRPQVKLVNGRWFTPAKREAVVSIKMAKRFANTDLGQKFKTGATELTVVAGSMAATARLIPRCGWMPMKRGSFDRENFQRAGAGREYERGGGVHEAH